jgi:ubiquinone/menaquinone biosynthesis C-methylase UbiE
MSTITDTDSTGWSATNYNSTASFVYSAAFTSPILDLLNVRPGEHVIDFGCGSGEIALEIQRRVGDNGNVVGVDFSESMVSQSLSRTCIYEHANRRDSSASLDAPSCWF